MPRSVSDFLDIHSSTGSFDTWSRSRGDDDSDSHYKVYEARPSAQQQIQGGGGGGHRRRRQTMHYSDDENSIIDNGSTAYSQEGNVLNDGTARTSSANSLEDKELTKAEIEAIKRAEYNAGRSSMHNPFDDASESSSLPSDEGLNKRRMPYQRQQLQQQQQQQSLREPRHSWNPTGSGTLYGAGSLLDEDSGPGPVQVLSPVEEDSVSSSLASSGVFSQPSDEQNVGRASSGRIAKELGQTFQQRRQSAREEFRRMNQLQQESALRSHPRTTIPEEQSSDREQYPDPPFVMSLSSTTTPPNLVMSPSSTATPPPKKSASNSDPSTSETTESSNFDDDDDDESRTEEEEQANDSDPRLALHDLCSEATSPDDVAWRNALYLLSIEPELATATEDGWTPLHVCCLGNAHPPDFMVRAILYCEPACARAVDDGGRLPLHMIAASSADPPIMQLLVEEYPQSVYKTDDRGLTPLHMLLRNDDIDLTMDRVRILLGQTVPRETKSTIRRERILQRKGRHLELSVDEVNRMVDRTQPGDGELNRLFDDQEHEKRHELQVKNYPGDVQESFQKLAMWKRKQRRLDQDGKEKPIKIDLAESLKNQEKNPAAIPAPPNMQLALHMAVRRKDWDDETFEDEDRDYFDVRNPRPNRNEVLRVIVSAYPRGLVTRDTHGHTPLMIVLLNQERLPNIELIQLLLGMTTAGYESPPLWVENLPLHESPDGKYVNPAMVSAIDTNQLPLHVAAEEMPSFYGAIDVIHSAYPGAVLVQDVRGRTPLHMALRNYQRIQPDPKVVSLLLTDRVAQLRDDDGFLPFDLLVGNAHNLPKEEPRPSLWEDSTFDPSSVYKRFFIYVVMQAPRPRNRDEALAFLQRLRMLPPWLRRQACSVGFIQDMLISEMASMEKCALILFSGVVWAVLLASFRLQMDEYTKIGTAHSYYGPSIYLLSSLILFSHVITWCTSASLSVFASQCLLDIWSWIDLASTSATIGATALIQGGSADTNLVASYGTVATGLLWASVIGYFARWWYGMAVFVGRTLRMSHALFWPLIAAMVVVVAFAEMFFTYNLTTASEDCDVVLGGRSLCNIREAFIAVYLMLLGTPLIDTADGSSDTLSSGAVFLISVFTAVLILFVVSLFISVVSEAVRIDIDEVALGYFWEPKLNFVFIFDDIASFITCSKHRQVEKSDGIGKKSLVPEPAFGERESAALGDAWTVMEYAIWGRERRRGNIWYVACCDSSSPLGIWPLRLCCLLVLPVWLAAGLVTCGLLWPPQVRRWLFRPSRASVRRNRDANAAAEYSATQVAGMRGDVLHLKTMQYERSNDVNQEISELKRMLYAAMDG